MNTPTPSSTTTALPDWRLVIAQFRAAMGGSGVYRYLFAAFGSVLSLQPFYSISDSHLVSSVFSLVFTCMFFQVLLADLIKLNEPAVCISTPKQLQSLKFAARVSIFIGLLLPCLIVNATLHHFYYFLGGHWISSLWTFFFLLLVMTHILYEISRPGNMKLHISTFLIFLPCLLVVALFYALSYFFYNSLSLDWCPDGFDEIPLSKLRNGNACLNPESLSGSSLFILVVITLLLALVLSNVVIRSPKTKEIADWRTRQIKFNQASISYKNILRPKWYTTGFWAYLNRPILKGNLHDSNSLSRASSLMHPGLISITRREVSFFIPSWLIVFTALAYFSDETNRSLYDVVKNIFFFEILGFVSLMAWGNTITKVKFEKEQSLIALLPGMPQGATLNRMLAKRFAANWGLFFGLAALSVVCIDIWRSPSGWPTFSNGYLSMFISMSFLVAYAVLGKQAAITTIWNIATNSPWEKCKVVARVPLTLALLALPPLLSYRFNVSAAYPAVALIAFCAWRWYRLGKEPGAFPMGRLAGRSSARYT